MDAAMAFELVLMLVVLIVMCFGLAAFARHYPGVVKALGIVFLAIIYITGGGYGSHGGRRNRW